MDVGQIMQIFREGLFTAFKLAAPLLIVSMCVGLLISILQAATQIHEQTLTFVPKLATIAIILLLLGPWMMTQMNDFTVQLFETIAMYV